MRYSDLGSGRRLFTKVTETRAIDAGDTVILQYVGRGTNDGPMGPIQATGRRVSVPFVDIVHFDSQGKIDRGETYFDMDDGQGKPSRWNTLRAMRVLDWFAQGG